MVKIVFVGGGIVGLAAAMMLARDGHEVTVVEREPETPPDSLDEAWQTWDRRAVGQFRLAHLMQALGTQVIGAELPDLNARLVDNGALRLNLVEMAIGTRAADDARYDMVTGRRPFLEWIVARMAGAEPRLTILRGRAVEGLTTGAEVIAGVPHVTGVRTADGGEIRADLVVDVSGRRGPTMSWLQQIGARAPLELSEDSGFSYFGRFYRSQDGSTPQPNGPLLLPMGSMSLLTIPSDNGTWSVTVYAVADDAPMRRLRDAEVFERVVRAVPDYAHWLDGEPISEMGSMAGVVDRQRRFVVDGAPLITGFAAVSDAAACTNPSLGRGMSFGLVHAQLLRQTVRATGLNPGEFEVALDTAAQATLAPLHEATRAIDRARISEMRAVVAGQAPPDDPGAAVGRALLLAATRDLECARVWGEIGGGLSLPMEVFSKPGVLDRVLQAAADPPPPPLGPTRAELLALVA